MFGRAYKMLLCEYNKMSVGRFCVHVWLDRQKMSMKYIALLTILTTPRCIHAVTSKTTEGCGGGTALYDAPSWALTNVTRRKLTPLALKQSSSSNVTPLGIPNDKEVWMRFDIRSPDLDPLYCYMLVQVKDDAKHASFSDHRCVGSNFTVSWGYTEENDAGIMTIVKYVHA